MDVKGLWKVDKVIGFDENYDQIWKDAQAIINDPEADANEKQMAQAQVEFGDDGVVRMMLPIPEGIPKEELDAAVAEGEIELRGNMMVAEQLVVAVDEFCLTNCREQLALIYRIHVVVDGQLTSSACHSTRRNQHYLDALTTQHRYLIDQR